MKLKSVEAVESHLLSIKEQKQYSKKIVDFLYQLALEDKVGYRLSDLKCFEKTKKYPKDPHVAKNLAEGRCIELFERIETCSEGVQFYQNRNNHDDRILKSLGGCGWKFCPICATKDARVQYSKMMFQIAEYQETYDFYMLTLTLPNNPHGFAEELRILQDCIENLGEYLGYSNHKKMKLLNSCHGFHGSFEITKNQVENTWHPHLHLIVAFPKSYVKELLEEEKLVRQGNGTFKKRKFINRLRIETPFGRQRCYSSKSVMLKFIEIVKKHTDKYNSLFADQITERGGEYLSIDFHHIDNAEAGIREVEKYLTKFSDIKTKEDLYVLMRDSHKLRSRPRRGIFIWTKEWDEKYKARKYYVQFWREQILDKESELNRKLIQYGEGYVFDLVHGLYNSDIGKFECTYRIEKKINIRREVPWTSIVYFEPKLIYRDVVFYI